MANKIEELEKELAQAVTDLLEAESPRLTSEDIENVTAAYQAKLEYNYWVSDQKSLIATLKKEIILHWEDLKNESELNGLENQSLEQ